VLIDEEVEMMKRMLEGKGGELASFNWLGVMKVESELLICSLPS